MTTVQSPTSHSTFVRHSSKVPNGVIKLQLGNELLEAVQKTRIACWQLVCDANHQVNELALCPDAASCEDS